MIIGTCGFGSTGSSAVSDYLLEYGNVQVLDQIEFTWVSNPDSLIDLDFHLNHPHNRTSDSITAIERYKALAKNTSRHFSRNGGIDSLEFEKSVEKFLERITTVSWNWYYGAPKNIIDKYLGLYIMRNRVIPYIEQKLGRQIFCYPMQKVSLSVKPDNFYEAARDHIKEILSAMGATFEKPLVLDQPFPGNNPQACFKFFEDPYAIVVDRDPRDNYVFAKTRLLGRNHFMACETVEDFVKYFKAIRDKQPYQEKNERVLSIKFEDMVYNYDETTKNIRDFLHLPENPNPKTIFDPAISMPNTQVWKRFPEYAEDIKYIERELKDYLFDFSAYPEPDLNGKMFFGKSPKNIRKK